METVRQQIEAEIEKMKKLEAARSMDWAACLQIDGETFGLKRALKIVESAIEREREAATERAF